MFSLLDTVSASYYRKTDTYEENIYFQVIASLNLAKKIGIFLLNPVSVLSELWKAAVTWQQITCKKLNFSVKIPCESACHSQVFHTWPQVQQKQKAVSNWEAGWKSKSNLSEPVATEDLLNIPQEAWLWAPLQQIEQVELGITIRNSQLKSGP